MPSEPEEKGYVIATEGITDSERLEDEYLPVAGETIDEYGGEILVSAPDPDVVEGEWDHDATLIVEFPSVKAAREWYEDETYQEVKQVRHEATEYTDLIVVPSVGSGDAG